MMNFILVNGEPVHEPDTLKWAQWFEAAPERVLKQEWVGDARVSTVFLGIDHNFMGGYEPILWETMIFGGEHDGYQERYSSRQEAEQGHVEAVLMVTEV